MYALINPVIVAVNAVSINIWSTSCLIAMSILWLRDREYGILFRPRELKKCHPSGLRPSGWHFFVPLVWIISHIPSSKSQYWHIIYVTRVTTTWSFWSYSLDYCCDFCPTKVIKKNPKFLAKWALLFQHYEKKSCSWLHCAKINGQPFHYSIMCAHCKKNSHHVFTQKK